MRNICALALVVLAGTVVQAFAAEEIPAVAVARPSRQDVTRWLRLPATVEADAEVTLMARVSGFLKDFSLDVGDRVKPGQLIGRLDAPELEQEVKLAEAQLKEAEGEYQKTQAQVEREKSRPEELDAQELIDKAEVDKAKADAAGAHNLCERTTKLFAKDAATEQERDIQQFSCQQKDAAVVAAEKKTEALKAQRAVWRGDLAVAEAAAMAAKGKAQVAQATLDRARVWWAYTEIKMPQVGTHPGATAVITKRFVANGDLISGGTNSKTGGQPIVTLQVVDPIRVVADIPESDAIGLEAGTGVRVEYPDFKGEPSEFKISRTSNSLASTSRTLRIEIDVANPKNVLRPGTMAYVLLAAETHKGVLAVPTECVVIDRRQASVFAVEGNKAKKIMIEAGLRSAQWIEVLKPPLPESTLLIKNLTEGISDGAAVEVK